MTKERDLPCDPEEREPGQGTPETAETDRDPLEVVAEQFVQKLRSGEAPTVEQYARSHPQLAEKIRDLFPMIAAMERFKMEREQSGSQGGHLGAIQLERLGDFRIIREIGRGGMGIVYEAEQESLGRTVAVKVLPRHALLEARHLERFRREAKIAAKLHHTNIVPVFGVGRHEGFHYYVMQYIRGVPLDKVLRHFSAASFDDLTSAAEALIAERFPESESSVLTAESTSPIAAPPEAKEDTAQSPSPQEKKDHKPANSQQLQPSSAAAVPQAQAQLSESYFRNAAHLALQVAEALRYAHEQGTLHRDIKPSNLLLDSHGVVWVTDFGLAKAIDQDPVSQTGDVVGTLRYMAPEQFEGKADPRTDLYGLGLTLYELVTLKPAFQAPDRRSLIHAITHESPPRPRRVHKAIPRDLETIVLKAVAREPKHRYRTAAQMATDLKLFLEDRPILSRRTSTPEKLWRWAKRNKAVACLSALSAVLVLAVAVIASVAYVHTRRAMKGEALQRTKAEETAKLAVSALDQIFERFAPSSVAPSSGLTVEDESGENLEVTVQPVLSKEAAALLEQLLTFYEKLARQGGDQGLFQSKIAEANLRVGDIHRRLGNVTQAQEAYLRALSTYSELAEKPLSGHAFSIERARVYNELGQLCAMSGDSNAAAAFHKNALTALETLASEVKALKDWRYEAARTHYYLARIFPFRSPPERVSPPYRPPGPRPREVDRSEKKGLDRRKKGTPPSGTLAFWKKRKQAEDPSRGPRRFRRPFFRRRGFRPFRSPRFEAYLKERSAHLQEAIRLLRELCESPQVAPDWRFLLAKCYRELGRPFGSLRYRRKEDPGENAREILEKLVADYPDVSDYRYELSETYAAVPPGSLFRESSSEEVETRLLRALELSKELVAAQPNIPAYKASQVAILHRLSELKQRRRALDEAERYLDRACELEAALVSRHPEATGFRIWEGILRISLARLHSRKAENSDQTQALKRDREALASTASALHALLDQPGSDRRLRWFVSRVYRELAHLHDSLGEKAEAQKARQHAEKLLSPWQRQGAKERPDRSKQRKGFGVPLPPMQPHRGPPHGPRGKEVQ